MERPEERGVPVGEVVDQEQVGLDPLVEETLGGGVFGVGGRLDGVMMLRLTPGANPRYPGRSWPFQMF